MRLWEELTLSRWKIYLDESLNKVMRDYHRVEASNSRLKREREELELELERLKVLVDEQP